MASHNVWTFSGNLGGDPESRQVGDRRVCNFSVAVNGRRDSEPTTWVRVAAWGGLAETCQRYLSKGRQVIVTGSARLREYDGAKGKGVSLEVDARDVTFIGGRDDAQAAPSGGPQKPGWSNGQRREGQGSQGSGWGGGPQKQQGGEPLDFDDPIPF